MLVTREAGRSEPLARRLHGAGFKVLHGPVIRVDPIPGGTRSRRLREQLSGFDAVVLTSANASRHFSCRVPRGRRLPPVIAIGPATAAAARREGLAVRRVAGESRAEGLLGLFPKNLTGRRILLPRAASAREILPRVLRSRGARVTVWPLYRTRPVRLRPAVRRKVLAGKVHVVTFTSGSTVRAFLSQFTQAERHRVFFQARAVSIGPVTSEALRRAGVEPAATARRTTIAALVHAVRSVAEGGRVQ